jgi:phosphoribosylglycinamide formyltransferase 2
VILASNESIDLPVFDGLEKASQITNSSFILFGKPTSRPYRRMGVALAYGNEDVNELVSLAKRVSSEIKVS